MNERLQHFRSLRDHLLFRSIKQVAGDCFQGCRLGGGALGIGKTTLFLSVKAGWGICFFSPVISVLWLTSAFTFVRTDTMSDPLGTIRTRFWHNDWMNHVPCFLSLNETKDGTVATLSRKSALHGMEILGSGCLMVREGCWFDLWAVGPSDSM